MSEKNPTAALYAKARAELVKRHREEYREILQALAADAGITIRGRRSSVEKAAAEAEKKAAVAERKAKREALKREKAEAARQAKVERAKARLAALEGAA